MRIVLDARPPFPQDRQKQVDLPVEEVALAGDLCTGRTSIASEGHINRRVPLAYQGRAFALQSVLKNGAAIVPLLTLGFAADAFGVDMVLAVSPILLFVVAVALVRLSFVFGGSSPPRQLDVLTTFWQESEHPLTTPDDRV